MPQYLFTEAGLKSIECRPDIHNSPLNYKLVAKISGRRLFDAACRIYGRIERSWYQVRIIAKRDGN